MGLLAIDPPQDLLSCAMGSWEFIHPEGGQGNPSTQINGYEFMKNNISAMVKKNLPWEMEIADTGFLQNAARLADDGAFDGNANNFWLDYVMGFGGMPATPRQLMFMMEEGQRLFPQAKWETNATGYDQFRMNILGAAMGCDIVRVGFEDSVYLPSGKQAKNNYEQVEAMAELADRLGREIATPAQAWEILGGSQRARAA
jgi:3-keto-5-aminohexanoate cleavage enzyme